MMLILYLGIEKYKEKAKKALCRFAMIENDTDNEYIWVKIFAEDKIDIIKDNDLASCILKSKISKRLIEEYSKYIERHHCVKEHSRELLEMCRVAILADTGMKATWGLEEIIVKTIISLYYNNAEASNTEQKAIVSECLDIWDLMYEKDYGTARQLTRKLLEV